MLLDPYVTDWLNLLVRWLHVIAAIAWVGSSFYFVFVDNALLPPEKPEDRQRGVGGELWEVHGGGFYHVQKYRVAPGRLPEPLHWFKWEAYTTWISGFLLLVVLYYLNPGTYLIDRSVADISPALAVGLSVALLAVGWLVYDLLCKTLGHRELPLAGLIVLFFTAVAWGVSLLFSGRATYIQVGAMLGTIMVANVFFNIIPAHRTLVAAIAEGKEPDPTPGLQAKQRSVHNNYFTLPVVFAMLSPHFPMTYGHQHGWLILVVIMLVGAWIRHFFNLRHTGKTVWAIPASGAAVVALLAVAIAPVSPLRPATTPAAPAAPAEPVESARVHAVVTERCTPCHSARPTFQGFAAPPKGVAFDTPQQIRAQAASIYQQAVATRAMPLGNLTNMTEEERALLAEWYRSLSR